MAKKVLVCEDDIIVLKVIRLALQNEKAETVCVNDGREALKKLDEHTFDMVITDIHMPYHNGDEILQKVRKEQRKDIPIIMISSDTEEEVIALAKKEGVNEFIKKPIDTIKLQKQLAKYLS